VKSIRRKARVPYSAAQMFDLVNDVEAYPGFLPWCEKATVEHASAERLEATLHVGAGVVRKRFSTRNRLERPHRIDMELLEGPFRKFTGEWRFDDVAGNGCDVVLALDFEMSSLPLKFVLETVFEELARSQVEAFVTRAGEIYG
jgi:ribosome-associated toxin RatA of RatAB toxin-antitoxin module